MKQIGTVPIVPSILNKRLDLVELNLLIFQNVDVVHLLLQILLYFQQFLYFVLFLRFPLLLQIQMLKDLHILFDIHLHDRLQLLIHILDHFL